MRTIEQALANTQATTVPESYATWPCLGGLSYDDCQEAHDDDCPGFTLPLREWMCRVEAYWNRNPRLMPDEEDLAGTGTEG